MAIVMGRAFRSAPFLLNFTPLLMSSVLTLTLNPAIDKSTSVRNVVAEHKLRCEPPVFHPGGGGINVSRAIYKLGGESTALYLAGGATGQMLGDMLDQEERLAADYGRMTHRAFPIDGLTRTSLTVFETTSTQQYRFNMPGPEITQSEWEGLLSALRDLDPAPDYLVASGSLPRGVPTDFYARIAEIAKMAQIKFVLDTSGPALKAALEVGVYLIKPNIREMSLMTERPEQEIQMHTVADAFVSEGKSEIVLVSLGAAGAFLAWGEGCERIPAPVVSIESKVGAGDSTVAGFVLALARGEPVPRAARFAVAAGSAAVMTPGTQLCRRDDTERLFEEILNTT